MSELSSWGYHRSGPGAVPWLEYLRRTDSWGDLGADASRTAASLARCMAPSTRALLGPVECLEQVLAGGSGPATSGLPPLFLPGSPRWIQAAWDDLLDAAGTPALAGACSAWQLAREAFRKRLHGACLESLAHGFRALGERSPDGRLEGKFHYLQGLVRLGSTDHADPASVDPSQAEQSFLAAARHTENDHPLEAARAFLWAGWAAYVQADRADSPPLGDALVHTRRARESDPFLVGAAFQEAKIQMALDQPGPALESLRQAAASGALSLAQAAADGDFQRHQPHLDRFLHELREARVEELRRSLGPTADALDPWFTASGDLARHPAALRLVTLGKHPESRGLLALLDYDATRQAADRTALASTVFLARRSAVAESLETVVETVPTGEVDRREVTEQETYWEEEVQPGSWFRKETRTQVRKVRPRIVIQEVPRMTEVRRTIRRPGPETVEWTFLNGLGEPIPPGRPYSGFGIPVVFLRPGTFMMGSPETEPDRSADEVEHPVTLTRPFALAQTPCTQEQWEAVMGINPSNFRGPDRPVEQVSWDGAVEFCRQLTARQRREGILPEGWRWRLPTEAEWEYAARAGTTGARHGELEAIAWHHGNSGNLTHPVKRKAANAWGLHDMMGNVWEWCADWYGDYPTGSVTDPVGPTSGSFRVYRGGSWNLGAKRARSASRYGIGPGYRYYFVGFRPALGPPG